MKKEKTFTDLKFSLVTTIIVLGLIVAVGLTAALH
ncbi:YnhF family membrane protein [Shigella flexneri]